MINLTKLIVKNDPMYIIDAIRMPAIYYAENIADYKDNSSKIKCPWYQRGGLSVEIHRARRKINGFSAIIRNVGINKFEDDNFHTQFFIYDESFNSSFGFPVQWDSEESDFPPLRSFEELQKQEGLKEIDRIDQIYLFYSRDSLRTSVIDVNKRLPVFRIKGDKIPSRYFIPSLAPTFSY